MLLFLLAAARAACPEPSTNESLLGTLIAAEQAYAQGDVGAFTGRIREARGALPCLGEQARPELVAAWHRSGALEPLVVPEPSDRPVVIASLRALLAIEPGYAFPESLAPQGNILPIWLAEAREAGASERVRVSTPPRATLLFDGREGEDRPVDTPVIVQLRWDGESGVRYTAALDPGTSLPDWRSLGLIPPEPEQDELRLSRPGTLAVAGGALALTATAGTLFGLGLANRAEFNALETNEGAEDLIQRSHTLTLLGAAAGLGAAGLAGVTVAFGGL